MTGDDKTAAIEVGRSWKVYPGFIQLTGFMTMNLDRHMNAHLELFNHLIEGDGKFGLTAYGYGPAGSYAYAGGADVKPIYDVPPIP